MPKMVIPKNKANSCHFMTLLNINISGKETVTMAVMNAKAVPMGTPFPTSASIIGMTPTEFAYKGAPIITAMMTEYHDFDDKYFSTKLTGTKPWIKAPMPTPKTT